MERPETIEFVDKTYDLLTFLLPKYQREGKAYLTVAIGCTGGKHRSVSVTAALAERMKSEYPSAHAFDRDVEKE
jgi:RNase adapter protein RapZ